MYNLNEPYVLDRFRQALNEFETDISFLFSVHCVIKTMMLINANGEKEEVFWHRLTIPLDSNINMSRFAADVSRFNIRVATYYPRI